MMGSVSGSIVGLGVFVIEVSDVSELGYHFGNSSCIDLLLSVGIYVLN